MSVVSKPAAAFKDAGLDLYVSFELGPISLNLW